jgi:hypothetical protein
MMVGDFIDDEEGNLDADHVGNLEGWITITPCNLDCTDHEDYNRLKHVPLSFRA